MTLKIKTISKMKMTSKKRTTSRMKETSKIRMTSKIKMTSKMRTTSKWRGHQTDWHYCIKSQLACPIQCETFTFLGIKHPFFRPQSIGFIFMKNTLWGQINMEIVTTPTQPQLNSKVGFDTKMTFDHHHHPPPHKLLGSNISAVTGPIWIKL